MSSEGLKSRIQAGQLESSLDPETESFSLSLKEILKYREIIHSSEMSETVETIKTISILHTGIQIDPIFREREFLYDEKLVFVLMPFSEPWSDRIWVKIREIIESHGLRCERADNRRGPIITEDIWTAIMEARVIVCDTTGWNPNVFYELGIAHTIGKPVILLTQPIDRIPFDTQGLRHLIYTDNPDGMRKLELGLPPLIDYYLERNRIIPIHLPKSASRKQLKNLETQARKQLEFMKKRKIRDEERKTKQVVKEAWKVNTGGFEPDLPPMKYQVLRGEMGVARSSMKKLAYALSTDEISALLSDVKRVWPTSWENMEEKDMIWKSKEIVEVVNSWKNKSKEKTDSHEGKKLDLTQDAKPSDNIMSTSQTANNSSLDGQINETDRK